MRKLRRRLVDASLKRRSPTRIVVAWVLAVIGPAIFALVLLPFRVSVGLTSVLFFTLLVVTLVSVIGGVWPAILAACIGLLVDEYFYTPPYDSLSVRLTANRISVIVFVVVGVVVGTAVGTLIDQLASLTNQQAALRRVATLVARAAPSDELFAAVTEEAGHLLDVDITIMHRFNTADGSITYLASWSKTGNPIMRGTRTKLEGNNISTLVAQTGGPVRMDSYEIGSGPIAEIARNAGARSGVGAPIIVEGRPWGDMIAASTRERPLPRDTEIHLASFTDLMATAVANAESREELAASRARVVASADEVRHRIERDLHDGAQQRLVGLELELRAAQSMVPPELLELNAQLALTAEGLREVGEDLQEITRGIHPAFLSKGGLGPAIKMIARRSAIPVEVNLQVAQRFPEWLETASYFVISEAITNAVRHSRASVIRVDVEAQNGIVTLEIHDDGKGGADPTQGSGLVGLRDRVEAFGGSFEIVSAVGAGTRLHVAIPIDGRELQPR
jgi:signal transduction histidine kinase